MVLLHYWEETCINETFWSWIIFTMTNMLKYHKLWISWIWWKTKLLRAAKTLLNNPIDIIKSFVKEYKNLEIEEDIIPERIILYQSSLYSKKSILHYLFKYGDCRTFKTLNKNYKEEVTRLLFEGQKIQSTDSLCCSKLTGRKCHPHWTQIYSQSNASNWEIWEKSATLWPLIFWAEASHGIVRLCTSSLKG